MLAIYVDDGAPVFFTQKRVGRNAKKFKLYKFRTMTATKHMAPEIEEGLSREELQERRKNFATTKVGDSRITKVGHFLRKTHLDELPQLLNVFLGHMSLVGPRPDTPVQEGDYMPHRWQQRCAVRPGITGLAQVNPKRVTRPVQKAAWDIYYVKHHSFFMDMVVLMRTALKVFKADSF